MLSNKVRFKGHTFVVVIKLTEKALCETAHGELIKSESYCPNCHFINYFMHCTKSTNDRLGTKVNSFDRTPKIAFFAADKDQPPSGFYSVLLPPNYFLSIEILCIHRVLLQSMDLSVEAWLMHLK